MLPNNEGVMIYTHAWWKEARESISVHLNNISRATDACLEYTTSSMIKNGLQHPYVTGPLH